MMDDAYQKASKALKAWEKSHGSLKDILVDEEYAKARDGIIARIKELYTNGGKSSEAMKVIAERAKKLSEREQRADEKARATRKELNDAAKETLYSENEAKAKALSTQNPEHLFFGVLGNFNLLSFYRYSRVS